MKKIAIFFFFIAVVSYSQQRFWIINDTRLYKQPYESDFIGYFKYGAEVKVISEENKSWLKVMSDNFSIGFVEKKYVSASLNGNDIKITDNENPILDRDDYYGSQHMFVTVAGLKARTKNNKDSKIKEILSNGEAVSVSYYPVNKEDWVNIHGTFIEEYFSFVQAKYLGTRPIFEDLIRQFNSIDSTNFSEQRIIAERIVELAWNSDKEKLQTAYQIYLKVIEKIGDEKLIEATKLNILIVESLNNMKSNEILYKNDFECYFKLNKNKYFSVVNFAEIKNKFGNPIKIEEIIDGCGFEGDYTYFYTNFKGILNNTTKEFEIFEINITNEFNFTYDNKLIYYGMSETEFINQFKGYFGYYFKSLHTYTLPIGDAGNYIVNFKNGKVISVEVNYYC
jgi:hypothetical protein